MILVRDNVYTSEVWKDVPQWEGYYQVSTQGRAKSLTRTVMTMDGKLRSVNGRLLKLHVSGNGYAMISLRKPGSPTQNMTVHRLVLETFVGPCPPGMECRHLNDIKTDNRLSNLCWGTCSENHSDGFRNGIYGKGEKSPKPKLKDAQAVEMRHLYATGEWTQKSLAEMFSVGEGTVWDVIHRKTFNHV